MRTPRRTMLAAMAMAMAMAVVAMACGADPGPVGAAGETSPGPRPSAGGERELLFLRAPVSLHVVDVDTGERLVDAPVGAVSADRSVVVGAMSTPSGTGTDVVAWSSAAGDQADGASGREVGEVLGRARLRGAFEPPVVSIDGSSVVLGPDRAPVAAEVLAPGRLRTPLALVRFDGTEPRMLDVVGNVEPEAFTTDGTGVIVVDYLPPEAPDRYRVSRLDLATGELSELKSPDAVGGVEMRGTARTQALSSDGSRLYTLYSVAGAGHGRAFVHVLDLREQWAHCIDLPQPFGSAPEGSFGVAVSADGRRLWVADSTADMVAELDTGALSVDRIAPVEQGGVRPVLTAGADGDAVFLAAGSTVTALDASSLEAGRSWDVDGDVSALRLLSDGRLAVVVGEKALLFSVDPDTSDPVARRRLPVLAPVTSLDPTAPLDQRGAYECAC